MNKLNLVGVGGLMLLAGACSSIDDVRNAEGSGSDFTRALTAEYRDLAIFEADQMFDYVDADHFAQKGLDASQGKTVLPDEPSERDLLPAVASEVGSARGTLLGLLDDGARANNPTAAARAQVKLDCWMEQSEENFQDDHINTCRDDFFNALRGLQEAAAPPPPAPTPEPAPQPEPEAPREVGSCQPQSYLVFFDFDDATVNTEGEEAINLAVEQLQTAECRSAAVEVVGHTDTMGSPAYNTALSLRRADNVVTQLTLKGISIVSIETLARGEQELRVPTPDETRNGENRRVEITIK